MANNGIWPSGGGGPWAAPGPQQNSNIWPDAQGSTNFWPSDPNQPTPPGPGWQPNPNQPTPPGPGWQPNPNQPTPSGPGWQPNPSQPTPSGPGWQPNPCQPPPFNQPGQNSVGFGGQNPPPGMQPFPQQRNMSIPYNQELPNGVYNNLEITIIGTVNTNPNRFIFETYSSKDIAFHFNPRFNEAGRKVIVANSLIGNAWGREEREWNCFPFQAGQQFRLEITCSNQEYKVKVNGRHLMSYRHRITNLSSIKKFSISGDVTLQNVYMQ